MAAGTKAQSVTPTYPLPTWVWPTDFVGNTAKTTTSIAKAMPYLMPEWYGAVGDGGTDDSTAINNANSAANTAGVPLVFSQKNYRVTAATLAMSFGNSIWIGAGVGTKLSTTSNISILTITSANNVIWGIDFVGNVTGASQRGIDITGNAGLTLDYTKNRVNNCNFESLNQAGIYVKQVFGVSSATVHDGAIYGMSNYFKSCVNGIYLDDRAEYCGFSETHMDACTTGIRVVAGNNNFSNGSITGGTTGIVLATGTNDGKCVFSALKINHNTTAVTSTNVTLGSMFVGCEMIVNGSITITGGVGHHFIGCTFNNQTITTSAGVTASTLSFLSCIFNGTPTLTLNSVAVNWADNVWIAGTIPAGVTRFGGVYTNTATLDFASIASLAVASLTITVTGAALGDDVSIGVPNGSMTAGLIFFGWVSATDTVSIQCYNSTLGAIDPASGTYRATVTKIVANL